jgi:uracil-DNA glycosylase
MNLKLESTWKNVLLEETQKPYFSTLTNNLESAYSSKTIFPPQKLIFSALTLCPFSSVRVVILGQDPYHGAGQAHGLSFSVPEGVRIPPSLKNIYKEISTDIGKPIATSGNLKDWAAQGILLLNSTLTVEEGKPGSHQKLGWETFTDSVIKNVSDKREHVVFLLWGNFARAKRALIDTNKHLVLEASHPSPLSAHTGFFGCKHFSKTNEYLSQHGQPPIEW